MQMFLIYLSLQLIGKNNLVFKCITQHSLCLDGPLALLGSFATWTFLIKVVLVLNVATQSADGGGGGRCQSKWETNWIDYQYTKASFYLNLYKIWYQRWCLCKSLHVVPLVLGCLLACYVNFVHTTFNMALKGKGHEVNFNSISENGVIYSLNKKEYIYA